MVVLARESAGRMGVLFSLACSLTASSACRYKFPVVYMAAAPGSALLNGQCRG